jgi:hypothetical protein
MLEQLKVMSITGVLPEEAIQKMEHIEDVTQARLKVLQIASRAGWGTGIATPYPMRANYIAYKICNYISARNFIRMRALGDGDPAALEAAVNNGGFRGRGGRGRGGRGRGGGYNHYQPYVYMPRGRGGYNYRGHHY